MKKGIEYLAMLSKEEQVLFLKNLNNISNKKISTYLLGEHDSYHSFITGSFTFAHSPEGHDYWWGISIR